MTTFTISNITSTNNKHTFHAFLFHIRNYSTKVSNIQRRKAELFLPRVNNFDINSFMTEILFILETNLLIFSANQWTGFYVIGTSVMKELNKKCQEIFDQWVNAIKAK